MSTTITPPKEHQDEFSIPNWTDANSVELTACVPHGSIPALVNMSTHHGSMSFHHSITPDQARIMAAQLMILADTAEHFEHVAELIAEQVTA